MNSNIPSPSTSTSLFSPCQLTLKEPLEDTIKTKNKKISNLQGPSSSTLISMPKRMSTLLRKIFRRKLHPEATEGSSPFDTTNAPPTFSSSPTHHPNDENQPPTIDRGNLSRVSSSTTANTNSSFFSAASRPPNTNTNRPTRPSLLRSTYSSSFTTLRTTLTNRNKPRCGYCCRILEDIPGAVIEPEEPPSPPVQPPKRPQRWESRIPEMFDDELRLKDKERRKKKKKIKLCGGSFCFKQFPTLDDPVKIMPDCEDTKRGGFEGRYGE